jgi:hypothetical protein
MDLAKSAANAHGTFVNKLPYFILVLLMVGTQYYQQRQLTSRNPQAAQGQQAQIMKFFPLLFGVFAIRFPAGVIVYWTVSNAIRIFQQWAMYRWDPKVKALVAADIKEVEAKTREIDEGKPPTTPTTRPRPRFRDLLGGATNPPAIPKPGAKPTKAGGARPTGNKPGGGAKPTGSKPGGTKPTGAKATPPSGKGQPIPGKPMAGKTPPPATRAGAGKPQPPPGRTPPQGGKTGPATDQPQPGQDDAVRAGEAESNGAPSPNGAPAPAASDATDGTDGSNGAPRGRTGAGGPRTGGNRAKRPRRGR